MLRQRPFLVARSQAAGGTLLGHTIVTAERPETSDEQEPPRQTHGSGHQRPWLAYRAVSVEGELNGKSVITRATPETSDEGDDAL